MIVLGVKDSRSRYLPEHITLTQAIRRAKVGVCDTIIALCRGGSVGQPWVVGDQALNFYQLFGNWDCLKPIRFSGGVRGSGSWSVLRAVKRGDARIVHPVFEGRAGSQVLT